MGIGTTAPNATLTLAGNTLITNDTNTGHIGLLGSQAGGQGGSVIVQADGGVTLESKGSVPVIMRTGSTPETRMAISSTGQVTITNTTLSTNASTGALIMNGGVGITSSTNATNTSNGGALTVAGGAAIAKDLHVGGQLFVSGALDLSTAVASPVINTSNTSGCSIVSVNNVKTITSGEEVLLSFWVEVIPNVSSQLCEFQFDLPQRILPFLQRGELMAACSGWTNHTDLHPVFNVVCVGQPNTTRGIVKFQSVSTAPHYFSIIGRYSLGQNNEVGSPSNVTASNITDTSVTVNWTDAVISGVPQETYNVYVSTTNQTSGSVSTRFGVPRGTQEVTLSGLTSGTNYYGIVVATNSVGTSSAIVSNPFTTNRVPGAPSNVTANNITQTGVTVNWTDAVISGVPTERYDVFISTTNTTSGSVLSELGINKGTETAIFTELTPGTNYYGIVVATNSVGSTSADVQFTTFRPPSLPVTVTTNNITETSVTVNWTDATISGVPAETYSVDIQTATEPSSVVASNPVVGRGTEEITFTNLTPGTNYIVVLTVFWRSPLSSSIVTVPFTTLKAPGAPSNVTANNITQTGVTVNWTDATISGVPQETYDVFISTTSQTNGSISAELGINKGTETAIFTELTPGTNYYGIVVATNSVGNESANVQFNTQMILPQPTSGNATIVTWIEQFEGGLPNIYADIAISGFNNILTVGKAKETDTFDSLQYVGTEPGKLSLQFEVTENISRPSYLIDGNFMGSFVPQDLTDKTIFTLTDINVDPGTFIGIQGDSSYLDLDNNIALAFTFAFQ